LPEATPREVFEADVWAGTEEYAIAKSRRKRVKIRVE